MIRNLVRFIAIQGFARQCWTLIDEGTTEYWQMNYFAAKTKDKMVALLTHVLWEDAQMAQVGPWHNHSYVLCFNETSARQEPMTQKAF